MPDGSMISLVSFFFSVEVLYGCSEYLVECKICTCNRRLVLKVIEAQACEQWNLVSSQESG